jgi:hypothetical protein
MYQKARHWVPEINNTHVTRWSNDYIHQLTSLYWIALSVLNRSPQRSSIKGSSLIDPVLLQEETYTKLTLFILDSSIRSKPFSLEVQ